MILALLGCTGERPVELPTGTPHEATGPVDTTATVLSSEPCDACGGDCVIEELSYPSAIHAHDPIDYADLPPAGGAHDPCWATWGVHREPVEDDHWVHNLEHGGVVYLYEDMVPSAVEALDALAAEKGIWVLVTPYAALPTAYAAVAWNVRMLTGCVDPEAFSAFYDENVDRAPESIPTDPGEACR